MKTEKMGVGESGISKVVKSVKTAKNWRRRAQYHKDSAKDALEAPDNTAQPSGSGLEKKEKGGKKCD